MHKEITINEALKLGVEAHKAGKLNEADQYYTAILKVQPTHPDANHNLGILAVSLDKVEGALPCFRRAVQANPNIAQFWLSYIDALIKLNRMADAKAVFDKAKSRGASGDSFDKIEKKISSSNFNKAKASEVSQEQLQNLVKLYAQGRYQETLNQASKLLKDFPHSSHLYNIIGVSNQGLGKVNKAIEALKKAISIKPDHAEAYYNMAIAFQDQGKLKEAIEAYNKVVYLQPDNAGAHYNMGNARKAKGQPRKAIEAYNKAVLLNPNFADAYNNMGNTLLAQGRLKEAIEAYKKVINLRPDYESAKYTLASLVGETPKTAPRKYVENLFDGYAKNFEDSLVGELEYNIPKLIKDILVKSNQNMSLGSVLDLGCGTGLLGLEIKKNCSNLEGIDLSNNMLDLAKQKNVYDKLSHYDLVDYLSSEPLNFDYYIALDVFIYVGDLSEIFRLIKLRSRKLGKLVFSTEHTEVHGFHILKTGRYSHSKSYVDSLCKKFGYILSHFSTCELRKEKNRFLNGGIYILEFADKN